MIRFVLVFALLAVPPAAAAETAWQDVAPEARMRIVTSDTLGPGGTTLIGVELDMPERIKTYWRVPGETGIPTQIDLAGSHGIVGHAVHWPYPRIDDADGYHDYVYYGPVVLPVELSVSGAEADVSIAVTLGICEEICIPVTASFRLPLDFGKADAGNALRLRQALAKSPLPWDGAPEGIMAEFAPGRGLLVRLPGEEIAPQSVIADIEGSPILFGAPQKSPDGLVLLPLLGGGVPSEGQRITLTFDTPRGPFEVEKPLVVRSTPR